MTVSSRLMNEVVISLEPKYAEAILGGDKLVELRRRRFRVERGTKIWFYAKVPVGAIVGFATIGGVYESSPSSIWRRFGPKSCISRKDFFKYFSGSKSAFAIALEDPCRLVEPVGLSEVRARGGALSPPQFFKKVYDDDHVLKAILSNLK